MLSERLDAERSGAGDLPGLSIQARKATAASMFFQNRHKCPKKRKARKPLPVQGFSMELMAGFEPATSS